MKTRGKWGHRGTGHKRKRPMRTGLKAQGCPRSPKAHGYKDTRFNAAMVVRPLHLENTAEVSRFRRLLIRSDGARHTVIDEMKRDLASQVGAAGL